MRIIAECGIQESLSKLYRNLAGNDFFVVDMESKYQLNDSRQDVGGIKEALQIAPQGKPVIMLGWQQPINYASKREWHAVLAYPHVVFSRHPTSAIEMEKVFRLAISGLRPADPLALKLLEVESPKSSFGVLRHDLSHALGTNQERKSDWLARARRHFGEFSDENLVRMVRNGEDSNARSPLAGQEFPDVCVDVEGTLFDQNGTFRDNVLQEVSTFANEHGKPVTIWTGGSIEEATKRIRAAGITWKIAAKASLRNAKVYAIFDDLPEKDFQQQYAVKCERYLRV